MLKRLLEKLHHRLEVYLYDTETFEQMEDKYYREMIDKEKAQDEAEYWKGLYYNERRCG